MQRLVDDQLDLARIESGNWQPESRLVELPGVLRESWETCSQIASQRGITFTLEEVANPTPAVTGDPDGLRQAFVNLIDNAIRYSPENTMVTARIEPSGPDGVIVQIKDQGPGIGEEHLTRIFERFYRVDPSRSRELGGTGLGLSIVKHIIEGHGGKVTAASTLGSGTTITCWLPRSALPLSAVTST